MQWQTTAQAKAKDRLDMEECRAIRNARKVPGGVFAEKSLASTARSRVWRLSHLRRWSPRYSWRAMFRPRLIQLFGHHIGLREETAILGVGRDLWMLAVGTVVFLNDYLMQVNIEIHHLPSIIVFVR
jgi:hypothetical protein